MAIGTATAIIGSAVIGAAASSAASKKAVDSQAKGAAAANGLSQQQFDQVRADNAGTRARGDAAGNELALRLGLNVPQYQQQQFTGQSTAPNSDMDASMFDPQRYLAENPDVAAAGKDPWMHWMEAGRYEGRKFPGNQAYEAAQTEQTAQNTQQNIDNKSNPLYGSLLNPFKQSDLANDPGYQFQLQQGNQAIDRSAAGRGNLYSGATLKALGRFNQGLAATSYNDAFNRDQTEKNRQFNMLSGVAGTGQVATNNVNNAGAQYANMAGQTAIGLGNAQAAATMSNSNAWQNALNQGTQSWLQYNRQQQAPGASFGNYLDPFFGGNGGSGD